MEEIKVDHTTMSGRECLMLETRGFNTATINAIRRAMLTQVACYGFLTELDPKDYKIITGTKEDRRNTVLTCTLASQSIPVLAQRCSRLAIHTDSVTEPLITSDEDRMVFFCICQKSDGSGSSSDMKVLMAKPLVGEALNTSVHSRDLIPVVLKRVDTGDDELIYEYDSEQSQAVKDQMDRIFPYNELIAEINHGQKLNVVLKPVKGKGFDNVRWSPCTFRYGYMMDPDWQKYNLSVVINGQILRKIEGQRSFKHLFTHKPPADVGQAPALDIPYNRFGKPYGHKLVFQYNGKMNEVTAMRTTIDVLINATDLFLKRYMEANSDEADGPGSGSGSFMAKETSTVSSEDGTLNSIVEELYIPKNTQDTWPEDDYVLTDETMGNLLTTKMLELVDTRIKDNSLWSQTHIAYKIPHPLVRQCRIMIKIPETIGFSHTDLITDAVQAVKTDLIKFLTALDGKGL